ncbi:MAG: DUF4398 domain-containing protein [Gammaproteobacteria bacterium]|nr:DUF4398 domain-containing protein [Gammaproteobacteria bacterium]
MKTIIKLAIASALALSLAACQSAPTHTLDQANAALKSAMAANGEAKKVNYEWRDTGKILKKARAAKGKGDFDAAVKLAGKAERQAINAVKQYNEQKNVKPML